MQNFSQTSMPLLSYQFLFCLVQMLCYFSSREIFPECGYSHNIRFQDILDILVQGKINSLFGVLIGLHYVLADCDGTSFFKRFGKQLA